MVTKDGRRKKAKDWWREAASGWWRKVDQNFISLFLTSLSYIFRIIRTLVYVTEYEWWEKRKNRYIIQEKNILVWRGLPACRSSCGGRGPGSRTCLTHKGECLLSRLFHLLDRCGCPPAVLHVCPQRASLGCWSPSYLARESTCCRMLSTMAEFSLTVGCTWLHVHTFLAGRPAFFKFLVNNNW